MKNLQEKSYDEANAIKKAEKRVILPVQVMKFAEAKKLPILAKLVLDANEDLDVIYFSYYERIIMAVDRKGAVNYEEGG